ncbi:MAG: hypothetical protein QXR45_09565, partial [Candidatus Bathyarchaeia archaeon]
LRLKELPLGMKRVRVIGERWATILKVTCILFLLFAMALLYSRWVPNDRGGVPSTSSFVDMSRAAIVDGIGFTRPNPSFIQGVREMLEGAGLRVDVYEGGNVTIDLLRRIGGYGLLILRLHSAIDPKYGFLYLFSAERFNETEYETRFNGERRTGAVREGITFENETYFTLRADLLGYMNQGGLNGSTIILMGCNGTNSEHAINRLFERGVKAIIAWDGYVDLNYTDKVTLKLIEAIYKKGISFEEAVNKIMEESGPDPAYKSKLKCLIKSG